MVSTSWADLNRDGRRLETVIRICMKHFLNEDHDLETRFGYLDRIIKATNTKVHVAEVVLGVREVLKQKQRAAGNVIIPSE